jgi:hypothetical protein
MEEEHVVDDQDSKPDQTDDRKPAPEEAHEHENQREKVTAGGAKDRVDQP